jgi:hypothetical protein
MALVLSTLLALSTTTIYHCVEPGRPVEFSDMPCRNGRVVSLNPQNLLIIPGLDETEIQRLHSDVGETLQHREQTIRSSRRKGRQAKDAHISACEDTREALDELIDRRRRGYTLQEVGDLDRQQEDLETALKAC